MVAMYRKLLKFQEKTVSGVSDSIAGIIRTDLAEAEDSLKNAATFSVPMWVLVQQEINNFKLKELQIWNVLVRA